MERIETARIVAIITALASMAIIGIVVFLQLPQPIFNSLMITAIIVGASWWIHTKLKAIGQ